MDDTVRGMDPSLSGGVERRRHPRFDFSGPVLVRLLVEEDTFTPWRFPGRSYNLSAGGVLVEVNGLNEEQYRQLIHRRRAVRVHVSIPEVGGEVVFFGRAVSYDFHRTGRGGSCWIGIEFDGLSENEQEALSILLRRLRVKILVVTEDGATRSMLDRILNAEGHEPVLAANGREALELLRTELPDVVFCDWHMPSPDGPELCRYIRGDFQLKLAYVILMAERREAKDRREASAVGADEILAKPLELPELNARLRVAFGVVEYHKSLRGVALKDALTGVANRRAFDAALRRETIRSRRFETPLSLAIIDVNGLKDINDRHGHDRGDSVLQLIAQRIAATCQREEVFRIGGDEFAVLLAQPVEVARSVAVNIRDAFGRQEAIKPGDLELPTISVGLANFDGAESAEELLHRADAEMYKNKPGRLNHRAET